MDQRSFTRREFVHCGLGLIGLTHTVPHFIAQTVAQLTGSAALAAPTAPNGGADGRVLVIVHLAGGNDGLNTVVPFRADPYYKERPRLAIPAEQVIRLDDELGLHPRATGFKKLWDDGQLAVVHGVGYPNPDRSHFVGTRIWNTASPDGAHKTGWLGRYFDCECHGADPAAPADPSVPSDPPDARLGLVLGDEMPLAMRGDRFMPLCVDNSTLRPRRKGDDGADDELVPAPAAAVAAGPAGHLDFLRRSVLDAEVHVRQVRAAARTEIEGASFPRSGFANSLKSVAQMIVAGMPTQVYYVSMGGYDTHAAQSGRHGNLLAEAGEGLAAFADALRRTGDLARTLVVCFSEFGRRVSENASGGTDHGEAGPMFLVGDAVQPGFHGPYPSLAKLHRGDLAFTTDFRQVYATVLSNWMNADAAQILGGRWSELAILKGMPNGRRVQTRDVQRRTVQRRER